MTKYFQEILHILNNYEEYLLSGISESNQNIFLLALSILILSSICMLCGIQVIIYLLVLYVLEHKVVLDKLSKYPILLKIINLYRKTRLYYLLFEIIFFFTTLSMIIYLCSRLVFGLLMSN